MDEYASIRLMSFWTTASTEPTSMVSTASAHTIGFQSSWAVVNVVLNTRNSPANPAALAVAAMNAVAGVGDPWNTSGVQVWNGTAATLKPSPTSSSAMPARNTPVNGLTFCAR